MQPWGRAVKPLWPLEADMIFLNHGSYGATPRAVLEEQQAIRDRLEAQPCRFINSELPAAIRSAVASLASFLATSPDDTVFVENTTTGINAILRSLEFGEGDEILTTDHVYNAMRNTARFVLEPVGGRLVEAPLGLPVSSPEAVLEAIGQGFTSRTRLLLLDHVASISAVRMPVQAIIALARKRGVPVLIDGAHAPGMLDLDIPALGCDWYVGNCHKWLCAPKGAAFLWASKAVQAGLHPTVISHDLHKGFAAEFDKIGTRDPSSWLAVPAALEFHAKLGGRAVRQRNHEVALGAANRLAREWGTTTGAPDAMFGSMATVALPGNPPATREAADRLKRQLWQEYRIEAHVMPLAGTLWLRISIQAYNEPDEPLALIDAMPAALSRLSA